MAGMAGQQRGTSSSSSHFSLLFSHDPFLHIILLFFNFIKLNSFFVYVKRVLRRKLGLRSKLMKRMEYLYKDIDTINGKVQIKSK